jgi:putative ABC transport system permease protein
MGTLLQDVRYGLRMLVKKPTFTIVAVLTLALGVGASTAIFSVVDAVLLRSLPFPDPDRLVRIYFNNPGVGLRGVRFSVPEFHDLRTQTDVFEDVSVIVSGPTNLTGAKQPEHLEMVEVSPNYFSMLGATPELGRLFGHQDFALGFAPVVVISDALWRRSYGADPGVLGRSLRLDNDLYTIVGVLSPGFRHPGPTIPAVEVWITCGFSGDPYPAPARGLRILPEAIGCLKPGLTLAQAQARVDALTANLRREFANDYPPQAKWTVEIVPLQQSLVGKVRPMLTVLMAAVVLIVFVVSLNIGSLLLARASGRQQEMAVRAAMGASRGRMIRQMLTESLLLAFSGVIAIGPVYLNSISQGATSTLASDFIDPDASGIWEDVITLPSVFGGVAALFQYNILLHNQSAVHSITAGWRILENSTVIASKTGISLTVASPDSTDSNNNFLRIGPAAGSNVYKLQVQCTSGSVNDLHPKTNSYLTVLNLSR